MDQTKQKQICLETLSFDPIEEIIHIDSKPQIQISIYTPFSQYCFLNRRNVNEIYEYVQHIHKHGFILLSVTDYQILNKELREKKEVKEALIKLNLIIDEILNRRDLITKQRTIDILGLNHSDFELICKSDAIIPQQIMGFLVCNNNLTMNCIRITQDLVGITLENESALQKFGKIWNLIEPELMGQIVIYKHQHTVPFTKLYEKQYSFKLYCLEFISNQKEIVAGTCQGIIILYQILDFQNSQQIQESRQIQLITTSIYKMDLFTKEELYLITDQQIKIVNSAKFELIGGGSLKARLENSWITSQTYDQNQNLLFLASSNGTVLIYKRTDKLQFITEIRFYEHLGTKSLSIYKNHLYPCTSKAIPIIKFKLQEDDQFTYIEQTAFQSPFELIDYKQSSKCHFGICKNGVILQWNITNGKISQAYKICDEIKKCVYLNDKIYALSSDGMLHIVQLE